MPPPATPDAAEAAVSQVLTMFMSTRLIDLSEILFGT
jgi:hypothetical protein